MIVYEEINIIKEDEKLKIYTDNVHRIIAVNNAPAEYSHEYEVPETFLAEYSDYIKTCFAFVREEDEDGVVMESTYLAVPSYVLELLQTMESETLRPVYAQARFAAMSNTDAQALQVKKLYPKWSALAEGTQLTRQEEAVTGIEITKVLGDDGKLYKVKTSHKKQSDWVPGIETSSLFVVIDEEHAGTLDDPIPAAANMIYYEGKYYDEEGTLYLCTRDSEVPLQYLPSQLVGHYFELV